MGVNSTGGRVGEGVEVGPPLTTGVPLRVGSGGSVGRGVSVGREPVGSRVGVCSGDTGCVTVGSGETHRPVCESNTSPSGWQPINIAAIVATMSEALKEFDRAFLVASWIGRIS